MTPGSTVAQWMRSPGHRANILSPRFRDIGISIVAGGPDGAGSRTYTVVFGVRG